MARNIFVVTHAQAEHHLAGVVGGWHDSVLTPLGHRQAEAIAERVVTLVDGAPVELYASDLRRAAQTAEPIARRLGVESRLSADLREKSFGVAGGKSDAWLEARWIPPPRDNGRLDHREGVEGAETRREIFARITRIMNEITASPCETQVIVTHGFALTFVIAAWFQLPVEAAVWIGFRPQSGGITHLQQDDRHFDRALVRLDDRAHLAGL